MLKSCLPITVICALLFVNSAFAKPDILNILTTDSPMPGFGDLVSNWYAALVLRGKYPESELDINFYVSRPFLEKFKTLVPEFKFVLTESGQDADHQLIGVGFKHIQVYWDSFGQDKAQRNSVIQKMLAINRPEAKVCNLAFTTNYSNIVGRGTSYFGRHLMEYALNLKKKNEHIKNGTPFLGFDFLFHNSQSRFIASGQPGLNPNLQEMRFPLYLFNGAVETGSLFISKDHPEFRLAPYDLEGHLGFAYAHTSQFRMEYIAQVANIAREHKKETYFIVLGSSYDVKDMDLPGGMSFTRVREEKQYSHLVKKDHNSPGVAQGSRMDREFYKMEKKTNSKLQKIMNVVKETFPKVVSFFSPLPNLYLVRYPDGVPFDVTQRVIRQANLPVLVSGTMSLSLAVQYDKPFLYEVMPFHRIFSKPLHQRFVGPDHSGFDGMEIRRPFESEILRFVPKEMGDNFVAGVSEASDLFALDSRKQRLRSEKFTKDIHSYRTTLRGGQMLDHVLDYCDKARAHYAVFRNIPHSKKKKVLQSLEDFKFNQIGDSP